MRVALARHDALMREAITNADGFVFKTVGDAFCAAFARAPDALSASLMAQLALGAEPWPEATTIKVRMALNTGAVETRDNDYFGPPVNRVARILSTGYGGQTLLSQVTYDLCRDFLPDAVSLLDLGTHHLKDLARPEQVYQLQHPGLVIEFPPLKSLSTQQNNLPQQMTSFIGREKEIAAIEEMLPKTRLLTLVASGGSGKTRLSLQVAANLLDQFPDGTWFVELAALTDPGLVPQAVATALGAKEEPGKHFTQTIIEHVKQKRLLVVLDNCEHLLDGCAKVADALIRHCPGVKVLASSREALGIGGEQTYKVPPLSLPDRKAAATPKSLSQYESVQLFLDRALLVRPDFQVTNQNAPALASLCCHLDGIPLAIELAAARVRSLSVEEIDGKLDQRLRLLTGGSRTALPRQQTLRALIDWSYDLLHEPEKLLLQRLSIFAGGWTFAAAEAVCAGGVVEDWEVLDLMTLLCDKSLVVAEQLEGHTRYRLLETVRQYSREKLTQSGGEAAVRELHGDFFLALAEEAVTKLDGAEEAAWLQRLEAEHANLLAAIDSSLLESESRGGLRLCGALGEFWTRRGYLSEGREWFGRVLGKVGTEEQTPERAKALTFAGELAALQGDYPATRAWTEESLAIAQALGDRRGIAYARELLGYVSQLQGDLSSAQALYEESLATMRELGDKPCIASSLNGLGNLAQLRGDLPSARTRYEEALSIGRELRDRRGMSIAISNLGTLAVSQGDYPRARELFGESLSMAREEGNQLLVAQLLGNLGQTALYGDDLPTALMQLEESLMIWRDLEHRAGMASALDGLGCVKFAQGDFSTAGALHQEGLLIQRALGNLAGIERSLNGLAQVVGALGDALRAARIGGAAEQLREKVGIAQLPGRRRLYDQSIAAARAAAADDTAFDHAWQEGRALTLDQAMDLAMAATTG